MRVSKELPLMCLVKDFEPLSNPPLLDEIGFYHPEFSVCADVFVITEFCCNGGDG